jgi:hypothetical protein
MTERLSDGDNAARALFAFLHEWAANERASSYIEQAPSGSFRRIAFRVPRDGDVHATLEMVACLIDEQPTIELSWVGLPSSSPGIVRPKYPSWDLAIESARRLRQGPIAQALQGPAASGARQEIAKSLREGIAHLPEPIPDEMREFLQSLEATEG